MDFRQTKHQVARGTRSDGESFGKLLLIKRTTELRATYQIRLLVYRAIQEGKKLVVEVPKECKIHSSLRALMKQHPNNLAIARV